MITSDLPVLDALSGSGRLRRRLSITLQRVKILSAMGGATAVANHKAQLLGLAAFLTTFANALPAPAVEPTKAGTKAPTE